MRSLLSLAGAVLLGLMFAGSTQAQHRGHIPQPSHYDYVPGHYDRHRGHSDYVPGHYEAHRGGGFSSGFGSYSSGSGYTSGSGFAYPSSGYGTHAPNAGYRVQPTHVPGPRRGH